MKIPELVIALEDIPAEGLDLVLNLAPERLTSLVAVDGQAAPVFRSSLTGVLHLSKIGPRLRLKGRIKVSVVLACDRCLAETENSLEGQVDETLDIFASGQGFGDPGENRDGGLTAIDGRVDLSSLLAELFWLAWPFRFICRPDCAGLCPHCGADLNNGPCACQTGNWN
ncbi:MAG: DUF177 domain-containing protein [Candidatus Adiutrix sp.]|nr:DUF177 domain-containing protein [Candidatus Adiutrix sp.]